MSYMFVDVITSNPWIFIVLIIALLAIYAVADFKKRGELSGDYEELFKYDLKILIITVVALTIPTVILLALGTSNEDAMNIFLGYIAIVTIALAIYRKDPVLKFINKVPSLSFMGIGGYRTINHYERDYDGDWEYTGSHQEADGVKVFGIILGIFMVVVKLFLYIIYIFCAALVNIGMAFIYVPLFGGLTIYDYVKKR